MQPAMRSARYRARQFVTAIRPAVSADEWQLVQEVFRDNKQALALFQRMPLRDQQHAVGVLQTLRSWGKTSPQLQQAALLHDVGKSLGQPLFYRVVVVLLDSFWPQALHRLAQAPLTCPAWRKPFVVHARHPDIGAKWAASAGCDPLVVRLIRTHQEPPPATRDEVAILRQALYKADSMN